MMTSIGFRWGRVLVQKIWTVNKKIQKKWKMSTNGREAAQNRGGDLPAASRAKIFDRILCACNVEAHLDWVHAEWRKADK